MMSSWVRLGIIGLVVAWSLPNSSVVDFHAGLRSCIITVGEKNCSTVGKTACGAKKTACRIGNEKKALTCKDGAGNVSQACVDNKEVCKAEKHAEYDGNCETSTALPLDP